MDWNLLSWLASWGNVWFWFEIFQCLLFLPKGTIFCSNKTFFSQTSHTTIANLVTGRYYMARMLWDQKENTQLPVGPPAMTKLHLMFYYALPQCQEPGSRLCWLHTVFSSVLCLNHWNPIHALWYSHSSHTRVEWCFVTGGSQEDSCSPPSVRLWGQGETWAILCHEAKKQVSTRAGINYACHRFPTL